MNHVFVMPLAPHRAASNVYSPADISVGVLRQCQLYTASFGTVMRTAAPLPTRIPSHVASQQIYNRRRQWDPSRRRAHHGSPPCPASHVFQGDARSNIAIRDLLSHRKNSNWILPQTIISRNHDYQPGTNRDRFSASQVRASAASAHIRIRFPRHVTSTVRSRLRC
jgi:hypothetical protein